MKRGGVSPFILKAQEEFWSTELEQSIKAQPQHIKRSHQVTGKSAHLQLEMREIRKYKSRRKVCLSATVLGPDARTAHISSSCKQTSKMWYVNAGDYYTTMQRSEALTQARHMVHS